MLVDPAEAKERHVAVVPAPLSLPGLFPPFAPVLPPFPPTQATALPQKPHGIERTSPPPPPPPPCAHALLSKFVVMRGEAEAIYFEEECSVHQR